MIPSLYFLCLIIIIIIARAARIELEDSSSSSSSSTNWAVLIAGSNGYYNYRHQADISHSYQILRKLGNFPDKNIIVMMYNDIVNNTENPIPGKLFNEPGGIDVYNNISISYQGNKVTAINFLNVIQGIKEGDTLNGPVLESKKNDNIFIYYSDHGATGLVAMPSGDPLYANDLINALNNMYKKNMYSQLVFYLEACESGSMFNGLLSNNTNIFATTAATPTQPSYAYYYNNTLQTYMADEYSIRWMQDSTNNWNSFESLINQFKNVQNMTKESQPQKYGDIKFDNEPIEYFEAYKNRTTNNTFNSSYNYKFNYNKNWIPSKTFINSRDVKLATLQHRYLNAKNINNKIYYTQLIEIEIEYRLKIDLIFDELIKYIVDYYYTNNNNNNNNIIYKIKNEYIIPKNFNCLKYMYKLYESFCENRFTDYSLKYVNTLNNLCHIYNPHHIQNIVAQGLQIICL